jgi:DNA-directed RNA polymerase subunit RPC12/RpoP
VRLFEKVRLRVLWVVAGVLATTVGVIAWTTLPAWPVLGMAVATCVLAVNSLSSKLRSGACLGCGYSIANLPHGEHGVICPECGSVTPRNA